MKTQADPGDIFKLNRVYVDSVIVGYCLCNKCRVIWKIIDHQTILKIGIMHIWSYQNKCRTYTPNQNKNIRNYQKLL